MDLKSAYDAGYKVGLASTKDYVALPPKMLEDFASSMENACGDAAQIVAGWLDENRPVIDAMYAMPDHEYDLRKYISAIQGARASLLSAADQIVPLIEKMIAQSTP